MLSYNPLFLNGARAIEVEASLHRRCVVGCQGTQQRAVPGEPYSVRRVGGRFLVSAGWSLGRLTNKAAGCALFAPSGWPRKAITEVRLPSQDLAGRCMGVALSHAGVRLRCFVLYFPPSPTSVAGSRMYFKTCEKMVSWLRTELREVPRSAAPVCMVDLNDGIGLGRKANEWIHVGEEVVGPAATRERHANGAGQLFREALAEAGLCLPGTMGNFCLLGTGLAAIGVASITWRCPCRG